METTMMVYAALAAAALFAVSFAIGRRTSTNTARIHELEGELEVERKNFSGAQSELAAAKDELVGTQGKLEETQGELATRFKELADTRGELAAARKEQVDYQQQVVEHFSGTSDLLRDLTLQYRAVYDHLADGVGTLCPEGSLELEGGIGGVLPQESQESEAAPPKAAASNGSANGAAPAESGAEGPA